MESLEKWELKEREEGKNVNKKEFCIVGESGSGKTSVAELLEKETGLKNIQSFTTRKPRYEGETGHIFTTEKQYQCNKAGNKIVAETYFNGNYYWTNKGQFNQDCIYVIDPVGVKYLKERMKDTEIIVIYLKASKQNRYIRMMARDMDNNKAMERIEHDEEAFKDAEAIADYTVDADKPLRKVLEDVKATIDSILNDIDKA